MQGRFDYFVILAGMRTGSNFLEANLNEYAGLTCHGELFNPHFIGHQKRKELFGVTLPAREADPMRLIARMREKTAGLAGFRLFQDHDPRVLAACLDDTRAAKIVLSRNPLDSYVSLQIAGVTGQWRLGDMKDARTARITFDPAGFAAYLAGLREFQENIVRRLQTTGQTAFFLGYDDVGEVAVMNGLARFLGSTEERKATSTKTKKQNPARLEDKVLNYDAMVASLGNIDHFSLGASPVFEPRRGPAVPQFVAAASSPLLLMPVRGGPVAEVCAWLAALDDVPPSRLRRDFTQKSLREWLRDTPGHRAFAVVRHPVARLHAVFCDQVLPDRGDLADLRPILTGQYGVTLPEDPSDPSAHRAAFLSFARFVQGNLAGQTSVRTDAAWASQTAILQGMAQFMLPDLILREDELPARLPALAAGAGRTAVAYSPATPERPCPLAAIHDPEIEALARQIYQRDYMFFSFADWRQTG